MSQRKRGRGAASKQGARAGAQGKRGQGAMTPTRDVGMDGNEEACAVCGGIGELICCDSCPRAYHIECAHLSTEDIEGVDEWFCPACVEGASAYVAIEEPESPLRLSGRTRPAAELAPDPRARPMPSAPVSALAAESIMSPARDRGTGIAMPDPLPVPRAPAVKRESTPPAAKGKRRPKTEKKEPKEEPRGSPPPEEGAGVGARLDVVNDTTMAPPPPPPPAPAAGRGRGAANNNNNRGRNVHGPTSALSDYLREAGISIDAIRARAEMRPAVPRPAAPVAIGAPPPRAAPRRRRSGTSSEDSAKARPAKRGKGSSGRALPRATTTADEDEEIQVASESDSSAPAKKGKKAKKAKKVKDKKSKKAKSKKSKGKDKGKHKKDKKSKKAKPGKRKRSSSSSSSATPAAESDSSFEAMQRRTGLATCGKCGAHLPPNVLRCARCAKDKDAVRTPAPDPKRRVKRGTSIVDPVLVTTTESKVPSLQELCIKYLCANIELVEALPVMPADALERMTVLVCRLRKLNNASLQLLAEQTADRLLLPDCAGVDKDGFHRLATSAAMSPHLVSLHLNKCGRLTDAALRILSQATPGLQFASLGGAFLITDGGFANFVKTHMLLTEFNVESAPMLAGATLEALGESPALTRLKLVECTAVTGQHLKVLHVARGLTHFSLVAPAASVTDDVLAPIFGLNAPSLEEVEIADCQLSGACLAELGRGAAGITGAPPTLRKLTITNMPNFNADFLAPLASLDVVNQLRHLSLRRCFVPDDLLSAVLKQTPLLTYLSLNRHEKIERDTLTPLPQLMPELTYVDLSGVYSVDDSFIESLLIHCPKLERVDVWGCNRVTETAFALRANSKQFRAVGIF